MDEDRGRPRVLARAGRAHQRRATPFSIGAACFPETHIHATSPEDDLRYLKEKVDAGVGFLITQLFFDNALYYDFVARARAIGIEVPIVPGILPITTYNQLSRVTSMCGATIPDHVLTDLHQRRASDEAVAEFGVAYATMQCADLLANGAPGIHFYTLNRSPATRAILSTLRLWRPWDRDRTALGAPRPPGDPRLAQLDVELLGQRRRAVGALVADVDAVVLTVGAHAPGARGTSASR